jgi:hypothetical protein
MDRKRKVATQISGRVLPGVTCPQSCGQTLIDSLAKWRVTSTRTVHVSKSGRLSVGGQPESGQFQINFSWEVASDSPLVLAQVWLRPVAD